jgi:DNA-binding Xre family transcriptional regulator
MNCPINNAYWYIKVIFEVYDTIMIQFKDQRLVQFGQRVRTLREGKGWSINDVAARGYLSKTDLLAIESGSRNFGFTTLLELSKSLSTPPSELLDFQFDI